MSFGGICTAAIHTEGYRSGHNGAVLKTVRAQAHMGSNPIPSASEEETLINRVVMRVSLYLENPLCILLRKIQASNN